MLRSWSLGSIKKMLYFTIIRHGETPNNVAMIVQSKSHGELTERGIKMAQSLGQRLQDEEYTHIFSSDLKRCRETTVNILAQLKTKIPTVEYTPILQERDYGDWEFQSAQVVHDKIKVMGLSPFKRHQVDVPNGETYEECKARTANFFQEILKLLDQDSKPKNVMAVSHGTYIGCLFDHFIENNGDIYDLGDFNEKSIQRRAENTCITRCSISRPKDSHKIHIQFSHIFDHQHINSI